MYRKEKGSIVISQVPIKNTTIVLMDHPASITIYQYVSIEVMSGSVSVFGYEINPSSLPLKVFSSEKTGLIEVQTETFQSIWQKKTNCLNLEEELYSITEDKQKVTDLLNKCGNNTVAVILRRCPFPPNLQYLELYFPLVLEFKLFPETFDIKVRKKSKDLLYVPKAKGMPLEFDLDAEKLACDLSIFVRSASVTKDPAPRILVCGPRNTGKSSLLRFLLNKILSLCMVAYHLNCDPGQTEFTPPGVVSLTKLKKPVIGPPFAHLKKPVSMVFTGGISAESSPDMYCKSICKLMDLYRNNYSTVPLFVDTMGWMEGLGLQCLQNVVTAVKPTILVELVKEDEISMFDYRECLPEGSHYYQISRKFHPVGTHFSPQDTRNLSVLAYLGKCQSSFEGPKYLNEIKPYCVSWDKIAVYIFGKKVPPYRMIEAVNASIVALCNVPETVILASDIPQLPKTLEDEPDNECIGYGLVRAVDEKKHLLYIISPLSLTEIQKVNAIIKGNIMIPDSVFLNQPLDYNPLPFTNERDLLPPVTHEEMFDTSILSLIGSPTDESFASNLIAHGSAEGYRKKIPRRYRRSMPK